MMKIDLANHHLYAETIVRNAPPAVLYECAVLHEGGQVTSFGALAARSGQKTGRSPKDKRIVDHPASAGDIWWGAVNVKLTCESFEINIQRATDYLNTCPRIYVVDGFAGWDPEHRLKVRVVSSQAYHALFMHNMLIRATDQELAAFGEPDFTILNAGAFPANSRTTGMTSATSIGLSFEHKEMYILGTQYAGEMKKGVFTLMNYLMPKRGVLSMHCSANEGEFGDVSLFFGLSGTGKTTLSADPRRKLIGDDEHCWSDNGIFNIEGGCYAKCIDLSEENEPEIYHAIRFGALLENVVVKPESRKVDFHDSTITENTRSSYPIEFIDHAKLPCVGPHPRNIIFLTCDAFGVLPPVAKLTPEQAMHHFISGYTAKVAGTEMGVKAPTATFSPCFGGPFLVWRPIKYAQMLADRLQRHGSQVWLVNTGWTGGGPGVGHRISIPHTRAILDAIHDGVLAKQPTNVDPCFGLAVPVNCPNVPPHILNPRQTWADPFAYDAAANHLAGLFIDNFAQYASSTPESVVAAGPKRL